MTTGVRTAIHSRRVVFDRDRTPLHWVPGEAQTTHTINVLHLLLSAGERRFVKVYKQVLDDIHDPEPYLADSPAANACGAA